MSLKKLLNLSFVLVLLTAFLVQAQTFYVNNQTGNDANPGTQALPKLTVGSAIIAAPPGSTISVEATGINYTEGNITINKALTFTSTNTATNGAPVFVNANLIVQVNTTFTNIFQFVDLTLTAGTVTGASNLTFSGNITRTAGTVDTQINYTAGAHNFLYDGGAAITSGFELPAEANTTNFGNLTTTAGTNLTLNSGKTINGIITTGGTLNLGGNTVTVNGANAHVVDGDVSNGTLAFTLTGAATSIDGGTAGRALPNITASSTTAGRTLTIDPAGASTITNVGSLTSNTAANITTNNTGTVGTVTLNGSGTVNVFNGGSVGAVTGSSGSTGTITLANITAGAATIASITQSGTGFINFVGTAATSINITGNVLLNTAFTLTNVASIGLGTITFPDLATTIGGTLTNSAGFTGSSTSAGNAGNGNIIFGNITTTVTVTGATTNSTTGGYTLSGAGAFTGSGRITFATTTGALTFTGGITNSSTLNGTAPVGDIIAAGLGGAATVNSGAVVNSSTRATAHIDFSNLTGVNTIASVSSTGSTGGDILFGNGNVVIAGSVTNSRSAAGADIVFGTGATGGTTVAIASITNSGASNITFLSVSTGNVNITGSVSNTSSGTISFTNLLTGNFTLNGTLTNSGSGTVTFPAVTTCVVNVGGISVSAGTVNFAATQTGAFNVNGLWTVSGGTLNILGGGGAANITVSQVVTSTITWTAGTINFTGRPTVSIGSAAVYIGGATTNPTFTSATTTLNFTEPLPNVVQTIYVGLANPVYPGPFTITNPANIPAPVVRFLPNGAASANLYVLNDVTFNTGAIVNSVLIDGVRLNVGKNGLGGGNGNFQNTTGYTTANGGYVMMSGTTLAQTVNAGAAPNAGATFGAFGVDNESGIIPAVTFTNATCTFTNDFFLAEGDVSLVNTQFSGTAPWPTVYRTEGTFTTAPTVAAGTMINVTYYGFDKVTALEVPAGATSLNNLTVSTTNGALAGFGIVTLGAAATVNGTLTIDANQSLYTGAFALTLAGASAVVNGYLVDDGTTRVQLAAPTGTVFSGTGTLPAIQVNAGSVGNNLAGAGLVSNGFGGDGVWGGGNDDFTTMDGSINYAGGAASSLTVTFAAPTAPSTTNFFNLTTAAGATFTLGANAIMGGNMAHVSGAIDLGGFTLDHRGVAPGITVGATTTNGLLYFQTAATSLTVTGPGTAVIGANFQYNDVTNGGTTQTFTLLSASTGDLQITGDVTLSDGTAAAPAGDGAIFDIGAGRTLTASGANVTVGNNGAFTAVNGGTTGILILDVAAPNTLLTYSTPAATTVTNLTVNDNVALTGGIAGSTLTVTTAMIHNGGDINIGTANLQIGNAGAATFTRTGATATYTGSGYLIWNSTTAGGFQHSSAVAAGTMTINKFRTLQNMTLQNARSFVIVQNLDVLNSSVITNQVLGAGPGYITVGDATNVPMITLSDNAATDPNVASNALTFANTTADFAFNTVAGGGGYTVTTNVWPTAVPARDVTNTTGVNTTLLTSSRQITTSLKLVSGQFNWDSPVVVTLDSGIIISRTVGASMTRDNSGAGAVGTLTAPLVNLVYIGDFTAAASATGEEYSLPTVVNNFTLNTAGTDISIAASRTIAGVITWNSTLRFGGGTTTNVTQAQTLPALSTVIVNGTVNWNGGITVSGTYTNNGTTSTTGGFAGTGTITNNFTMNLDALNLTGGTFTMAAGTALNLTGDAIFNNIVVPAFAVAPAAATLPTVITSSGNMTFNGTFTNNIVDFVFGGTSAQTVNLGGNRTINNVTLAKTADETVTLSGGNLTLNAVQSANAAGLLTLTRGILIVGNIAANNPALLTIQATVTTGIITNTGYLRNPANNVDKAHVSGRLGVFIAAGTIGRTEWPVGSPAVNGDYRPAALTFTAGNATIAPTTIIVNHQDGIPVGDKNLPVNGGTKFLAPDETLLIGSKAPYYWAFESTTSLGASQLFDVELQGTNLNKPIDTHNDLRVIRRFDGDVSVNGWFVEGELTSYSNAMVADVPNPGDTTVVVRNRNSRGSAVSQKAFFTVGIPTSAQTYAVTGTVTYDNTGNDPFVGATVQLLQGGAVVQTAVTDAAGAYAFAGVEEGSYTVTATYAGAWPSSNAADALAVANHYSGQAPLTGLPLVAADVNASNTVNNTDALLIVRRFAGLITSFTAGDWAFGSSNVTVVNADVVADFKGIAVGDANKSAAPAALPKTSNIDLSNGQVLQVAPNKEFELPVSVSSDMNIGAISLTFSYPKDLVELIGVKGAQEGVLYNDVDGEVKIAWVDLTGGQSPMTLKSGDMALVLQFKPTEKFTDGTSFSIEAQGENEIASVDGKVINKAGLKAATVESFVPKAFALSQNYPNPFNPSTVIEYSLPENSKVTLTIYNILGQEVARILDQQQEAGVYKVNWNATGFASGVYIYNISVEAPTKNYTDSKRMMLLK